MFYFSLYLISVLQMYFIFAESSVVLYFSPDILRIFFYCLQASIIPIRKSVELYKWSTFPLYMFLKIFLSLAVCSLTMIWCVCVLFHLRLYELPDLGLVFFNNSSSFQILSLQILPDLLSLYISFQNSRLRYVRICTLFPVLINISFMIWLFLCCILGIWFDTPIH